MNLTDFAALSVVLTGFDKSVILPALDTQNVAQEYLNVLTNKDIVDPALLAALESAWLAISPGLPLDQQELAVKEQIMGKAQICRLAQNIIYMWYLATWYDMGSAPTGMSDKDFVVSSNAYKNSLVWTAAGAHPMGYSEGEYGYWSNPPVFPATQA